MKKEIIILAIVLTFLNINFDNILLKSPECIIGNEIVANNTAYYCSIDEVFVEKKADYEKCSNNFECQSNFCSYDICHDRYDEMINYCAKTFNEGYEECLTRQKNSSNSTNIPAGSGSSGGSSSSGGSGGGGGGGGGSSEIIEKINSYKNNSSNNISYENEIADKEIDKKIISDKENSTEFPIKNKYYLLIPIIGIIVFLIIKLYKSK